MKRYQKIVRWVLDTLLQRSRKRLTHSLKNQYSLTDEQALALANMLLLRALRDHQEGKIK